MIVIQPGIMYLLTAFFLRKRPFFDISARIHATFIELFRASSLLFGVSNFDFSNFLSGGVPEWLNGAVSKNGSIA